MISNNRFQRLTAVLLLCTLCGAIAYFRKHSQAAADAAPHRATADAAATQVSAASQAPTTSTSSTADSPAAGRPTRAVTDSPAEQKLIEQLQPQESAAAELAAKIRRLQTEEPTERNQKSIAEHQREFKNLLSIAFDLKLQLEELQVKELQSRLSRLERQIGQRRALRDTIIDRRAAELLDENGLQWDTSSPLPPPGNPSGRRPTPAPAVSPKYIEMLRRRAELLFEGLKIGEVKPAFVLSSLRDVERLDPEFHAKRMQSLLDLTHKLHTAGQITEAELLEIEAACSLVVPVRDGASLKPNTDNATRLDASLAPWKSGVTMFQLSGDKGMHISIEGHEKEQGATARYSIQRLAGEARRIPFQVYPKPKLVQNTPGLPVSIGGRLDFYSTDRNHPEADAYLQNNLILFQISQQDTRVVSGGDDVTKVVVMRFLIRPNDKKIEKIELETLDSSEFPPGTDLIEEAPARGEIVAVLSLSKRFTANTDPTPESDGGPKPPSNSPANPSGVPGPIGQSNPVSRHFPLRFKLASDMIEDLRQILLGRPGHEAKPSVDNQEVLVVAPADVMGRVQTFISVMDWPEGIARGSNYEYPRGSVIEAARSFFYACAIEDDPEVFSKMLSLHAVAVLKGDTKSENFNKHLFGGTSDPEWEESLRGEWPGKKEAIRRFVGEWNRYPLKRITETGGVAIGFGAKHFCSVSFAGAPQEFYEVTVVPDGMRREGDKTSYLFNSLPPWWNFDASASEPATSSRNALEGVWELVSPPGIPEKNSEDQRLHLVFAGGWHATYRGTQRFSLCPYRIDQEQTPHHISLAGNNAMRGIYEIKENGLRLSLAPEAAAFPTKFGTDRPEFERVTGKLAEEQLELLKELAKQQ